VHRSSETWELEGEGGRLIAGTDGEVLAGAFKRVFLCACVCICVPVSVCLCV